MGGKSSPGVQRAPTPTPDVDVATTAAEKALVAAGKDSYAASLEKKNQRSNLGSTGQQGAAATSPAGAQQSGGGRRGQADAAGVAGMMAGRGGMGQSAVMTG